jgi:glycosyltransferase involved in cell wall biosynthesis
VAVIYIVTAFRGSMSREVARVMEKLEDEAGAHVITIFGDLGRRAASPRSAWRRPATISRFQTARYSMTPRLLKLRNRWSCDDTVLVISWYVVPILMLVGIGLLPRPRRLVSFGMLIHNPALRHMVNQVLRRFEFDGLEFIVVSDAERANLVDVVGIPAHRVHRVLYRHSWSDDRPSECHGGYIFTGGYTHRDYATFFAAVAPLPYDVIAIASQLNDVSNAPPNVDLRIARPKDEFEQLVAGCSLLVVPLRAGGEACGQTVLLSGIRHHRPIVATYHDSLVDYLGFDYPGFVPSHDAEALRSAITQAVSDPSFRRSLVERVHASALKLREMGNLESDFLRILAPGRAVSRFDGTSDQRPSVLARWAGRPVP